MAVKNVTKKLGIGDIDPATGDRIAGIAPITGGGEQYVYDWEYAPGQNAQGQTEGQIYQDWLTKGLVTPEQPKIEGSYTPSQRRNNQYFPEMGASPLLDDGYEQATGASNYMSWLEGTKGGFRAEAQSKFAKEIPTVTNASFSDSDSLVDSITNAGYSVIKQDNIISSPTEKQDSYTVARYDPVSKQYTDPTTFYVNQRVEGDGIVVTTGQAFDAMMGQGRVGEGNPAYGVPGDISAGVPDPQLPFDPSVLLPGELSLSDYRALNTDQRLRIKSAIEANKMDWGEWLNALKDTAPAVVSYQELRLMNAADKAKLRQQVEDAGLSWADYVDQIYEPWRDSQAASSFNTPRRVSYAIPRG